MNLRRLAWLQRFPDIRYAAHEVISMDNVLIDHAGQFIDDVGWLWDHADQRHVIAHDCLIANYICPSGKHYASGTCNDSSSPLSGCAIWSKTS